MEALQKKYGISNVIPLSGETPAPTAPQGQPEYASAKQRYESSTMLLNTLRELSVRQKVDEGVVKPPIEVLEVARP